jgi:hypothetical protein
MLGQSSSRRSDAFVAILEATTEQAQSHFGILDMVFLAFFWDYTSRFDSTVL